MLTSMIVYCDEGRGSKLELQMKCGESRLDVIKQGARVQETDLRFAHQMDMT